MFRFVGAAVGRVHRGNTFVQMFALVLADMPVCVPAAIVAKFVANVGTLAAVVTEELAV